MSPLYLLDTCFVSNALKPGAQEKYPALVERFRRVINAQGCYLSIVTCFEIRRGLEESLRKGKSFKSRAGITLLLEQATIFDLGDADSPAWRFAADVWATAKARKPPLQPPTTEDLLIVATAHAHGFTLLTMDKALVECLTTLGFGAAVELVSLA